MIVFKALFSLRVVVIVNVISYFFCFVLFCLFVCLFVFLHAATESPHLPLKFIL